MLMKFWSNQACFVHVIDKTDTARFIKSQKLIKFNLLILRYLVNGLINFDEEYSINT